jgi:hypothetical protein
VQKTPPPRHILRKTHKFKAISFIRGVSTFPGATTRLGAAAFLAQPFAVDCRE